LNRINRVTSILIQLQSKKIIPAKEIAQRFNISLRTVYRDIRTLEEAGIPIGSEAGKGYFLVEGFLLPPVMFTAAEVGALITAGKFLNCHGDESFIKDFDSAMYKIKSILKHGEKNYAQELENSINVYSTSGQKNTLIVGNLGAQKEKRNDTPISAKKDIMGDKTVRVRADLHHIIKIETAKNGGNVKEVMEIRLRSKLKSVLILQYLKILCIIGIEVKLDAKNL